MLVKTMKGATIDISSILVNSQDTVAVGNANMNARGDIVGEGGKIIKRREEVAADYHKHSESVTKTSSIKDVDLDVFMTPQQVVEKYTPTENKAKKPPKEVKDD